jgi:hypothetical protein
MISLAIPKSTEDSKNVRVSKFGWGGMPAGE